MYDESNNMLGLTSYRKAINLLKILLDFIVIIAAYSISYQRHTFPSSEGIPRDWILAIIISFCIWLIALYYFNLVDEKNRSMSLRSILPMLPVCFVIGMFNGTFDAVVSGKFHFAQAFSFAFTLMNGTVGYRFLVREILRRKSSKYQRRLLVFGISDDAIKFANAMSFSSIYKIVGFVVEDNILGSRSIMGLNVYTFDDLLKDIEHVNFDLVVVVEDGADNSGAFKFFNEMELSVKYAPAIDETLEFEVPLKPVDPEDLLGRKKTSDYGVSSRQKLSGQRVFISGAGGSIGQELSKQLLELKPEILVVLDNSEFNLYTVLQEIEEKKVASEINCRVVGILGSVNDQTLIRDVLDRYSINYIYHAAAYKHVPIVEENILQGVTTNIFGTYGLAKLAAECDVANFVLISTDKAVRPTNVMGATKRVAELICQSMFCDSDTKFSIVRFGNVLSSSGSVIPLFNKQIANGGPITVTHPDITRYFMTISEASKLVIHASVERNSDQFNCNAQVPIYLLDMGEPVKILELAKTICRLHGLNPKLATSDFTKNLASNEILIQFTGLRPGEKLYEELLVDGTAHATGHPAIFQANERSIEIDKIKAALERLKTCVAQNDANSAKQLLKQLPIEYVGPDDGPDQNESLEHARSNPVQVLDNNYVKNDVSPRISNVQNTWSGERKSFIHFITHFIFRITRGMTLGVRVAIFNPRGEVLIVKHRYENGWHLPGGGVEIGETIIAAAEREVKEETGLGNFTIEEMHGIYQNTNISKRDHVIYLTGITTVESVFYKSAEVKEAKFVNVSRLPNYLDKTICEKIGQNKSSQSLRRPVSSSVS